MNWLKKNNSKNLNQLQSDAQLQLRLNEIKVRLDRFNYEVKCAELRHLKENENEAKNVLDEAKDILNSLRNDMEEEKDKIKKLLEKTISEKKLAENINKKLKHLTSFELVHYDNDGQGYYCVHCLRTQENRDVTQLSTGEKNIIAFLYFIEKLDELVETPELYDRRIIVFDDPMTSNDDSMQYLMIDELQKLMRNIKDEDRLIILTHNKHFYLNIKYQKSVKRNLFYRLNNAGKQIFVDKIEDEKDDYKTSYQSLWYELDFLYINQYVGPEMLLNPIRRIIETFVGFNSLSKNKFYEEQIGAKKLFDVNSHSIDDLEADLNGKTKDEIIDIMKRCFIDNGIEEHLNTYWTH